MVEGPVYIKKIFVQASKKKYDCGSMSSTLNMKQNPSKLHVALVVKLRSLCIRSMAPFPHSYLVSLSWLYL